MDGFVPLVYFQTGALRRAARKTYSLRHNKTLNSCWMFLFTFLVRVLTGHLEWILEESKEERDESYVGGWGIPNLICKQ